MSNPTQKPGVSREPPRRSAGGADLPGPVAVTLLALTNGIDASTQRLPRVHLASRQWSFPGFIRGGEVGAYLAGAGDVNGDGFPDLLVGARRAENRRTLGAVHLIEGDGTQPRWREDLFPSAAQSYGMRVSSAGDVNRDGFADFLVGAPQFEVLGRQVGMALLGLGGSARVWKRPDWSWTGFEDSRHQQRLGNSLAAAGDVNRDGYADVIIAAPRYRSPGSTLVGAAFVFHGGASGLSLAPDCILYGRESDPPFAAAVAGAGDVNGDGFDDVIVGAPGADGGTSPVRGAAFVFLGSPAGISTDPAWTFEGPAEGSRFGASVASAGDLDGDGCSEVVVGAPGLDPRQEWRGWVGIYRGSKTPGEPAAPAWSIAGPQRGCGFGHRAMGAGDIDGDSHPDLIVSAPYAGRTNSQEGVVFLYRGNGRTVQPGFDWMVCGGQEGSMLGLAVTPLGDFNRDGFGDFAVSAPGYDGRGQDTGRLEIFLGANSGYRAGNIFPSDGISSTSGPGEDPTHWKIARASGTSPVASAPANEPAQNKMGFRIGLLVSTAAGLILVMGGIWWGGRKVQNKRVAVQLRAEAERARHEERDRLARDLHDDLGAQLTRISLLTELVRRGAGSDRDKAGYAEALAGAAAEALENIEQIIWTTHPSKDTLENLASFLSQYGHSFFAPSDIVFSNEIPETLPGSPVPPEIRKAIFLAVKEAFHNVLKHSGATEVNLRIQCDAQSLEVIVSDNGRGLAGLPPGPAQDGLASMRQRMQGVGGEFEVEKGSADGRGVRVILRARWQ